MSEQRTVALTRPSVPTIEGAGVRLRRAFGADDVSRLDPFLLFDDFRGERPQDYRAGFPWHPHRGIETITYLVEGAVEHGDSIGNSGFIRPGDVQWMTAGSGIIHQEMPRGDDRGHMGGFQLWANLPAAHKMTEPRYRGVTASEIPAVRDHDARVHVIAGQVGETIGPVRDIIIDPEYLDVEMDPHGTWSRETPAHHTVFAYLFAGAACFGPDGAESCAGDGMLVLFDAGSHVAVRAGASGARFLFVAGEPLQEPVAWGGPIVMNTQDEVRQALREYRNGTFIGEGNPAEKTDATAP